MTHTPLERLLVFLAVVGLALCSAGWRTEADAWTASVQQWFDVAGVEQDCAQLEAVLEAWQRDHQAAMTATTEALVEQIATLDAADDVNAVDTHVTDFWDQLYGDREGFARIGTCMQADEGVQKLIGEFDAVASTPVTEALVAARTRIETAATAAATGANMELARVAAETFARTVTRYKDAVTHHAARGCEALADAHSYWTGNYYEVFDSSSTTLSGEIQRMTADEFATLEPLLASVETDRAALETVEQCADSLTGEAATRLEAQRAQLAWIIQLVRVSRPLEP